MMQNAGVTAFTFSELLRENQAGVGVKLPPPSTSHTQVTVNFVFTFTKCKAIGSFER